MLMRRGMIDDIRMISCKHGFKALAVSDGAYEHLDIDFRMSAQKLVLDIISVVLIDIENYELVRRMLRQSSLPIDPPPPVTRTVFPLT